MRKTSSLFSILAIPCVLLLCAGSAQAQATRTWVSGVGDDANPCSRTAPCKTFAGAISKTAASGEINVLDPGGFGAVTITKAITIANDSVGTAGVLVVGTNGIVVAAGASDVVRLRGLDIDGVGSLGGSLAGVQFNSGAQLIIENCKVYGFQGGGGAGSGINFQPSGASALNVVDTQISSNGSTTGPLNGSGNVLIQPKSGGSANAQFERVQLIGALRFGIRADGTLAGAGATNVSLHNVIVDSSGAAGVTAVTATTGGPAVNVMMDESSATNNVGVGVRAQGATATVRMTRSTVTNNAQGLQSVMGGVIASYANNNVSGNGVDGAPTTTIAPQ